MGLRINQNVEAMNAYRHLSETQSNLSSSLEKLSSGFRINRAADDAAGLSISEKLRAQISGFQQSMQNAQDGISMLQTGEGALNETTALLQRVRQLAVQAANGTQDTESRTAANNEVTASLSEIDRISTVSAQRSSFGAVQNRLQHTVANLGVAVENLSASESRIRDVDMASEMVKFTKDQILSQAGTAMLAQANQAPQSVLSLLRG